MGAAALERSTVGQRALADALLTGDEQELSLSLCGFFPGIQNQFKLLLPAGHDLFAQPLRFLDGTQQAA